jgi:hypothetical protein
MIESQLRALFTEIADGQPPSSRVDPQLAQRKGRARQRWRRACLAAAPVLASATAAAVAIAVAAVPARHPAEPTTSAPPPTVAPRQFYPLIPYAAFGWLPAGNSLMQGITSRTSAEQMAGPNPSKTPWWLVVNAAGQCHLTAARDLNCTTSPMGPLAITGRAPAVLGHRAFWSVEGPGEPIVHPWHVLVWQYARGGWAMLNFWPWLKSQHLSWRRDAVKVASHIRYGVHAAPPLAFPTRLTGVPASWQVSSVFYRPHGTVLQASQYSVTTGAAKSPWDRASNLPFLTTDPATARSSCIIHPHGQSSREVINGYQVIVSHLQETANGIQVTPPHYQQLCAAHADGLKVVIAEIGKHPALSVVSLFAHHLQLLGTDPANWARKPIG